MNTMLSPSVTSLRARVIRGLCCCWVAGFLPGIAAATAPPAEANEPLPKYEEVFLAAKKQLAKRRGYRPNDILSQTDVKNVLRAIEKLGWNVAEQKPILQATLADNDFLVQQLRSPKGVPFMRKLSKTNGAYARLDQLRRLKYGNRRIVELINNPGGHTLILYMTNTKGGRNLNRQLRRTRNGENFGKPTMRIYTGSDLAKQLRKSYQAECKRRGLPVKSEPVSRKGTIR